MPCGRNNRLKLHLTKKVFFLAEYKDLIKKKAKSKVERVSELFSLFVNTPLAKLFTKTFIHRMSTPGLTCALSI